MQRYCKYCNTDFEVNPKAITSREDLICPNCGNKVDKNSRRPAGGNSDSTNNNISNNNISKSSDINDGIENAISKAFRISYLFYVTLALIGIICYFLHAYKVMYIMTAIVLVAYIIQLVIGSASFVLGVILIPVGGALGFFLLHGLNGACLGILAIFFIRHVIRDIFLSLIEKLISAGSK